MSQNRNRKLQKTYLLIACELVLPELAVLPGVGDEVMLEFGEVNIEGSIKPQ